MSSNLKPHYPSESGLCPNNDSFSNVDTLLNTDILQLFMNDKEIYKEYKSYSEKMKTILKKYHFNDQWFKDQKNHLPIPDKVTYETKPYKLISSHGSTKCMNPLCQVFENKYRYQNTVPMYNRSDDNVQLCAVCVGL
tara:strand:- start:154 stop:564 length:411 start_codon:yes stop_codon:yes gene_type:complete